MKSQYRTELERIITKSDCGFQTTIIISEQLVIGKPGKKEYRTAEGYICMPVNQTSFKIINHPTKPDLIVKKL